jgi:molybdopterin-guanine dinucleotide biosynthesis protein A
MVHSGQGSARRPATPPPREQIAGVVLAGGAGTRMGGADKGWVAWRGRPLVEHVVERLRPQVGAVLISANRNLERYRALGCEVVEDDAAQFGAFPGPLAGILSGLEAARARWAAFVPCDAPCLPADLVARLAREGGGAPAVARCGTRVQPVFCLLPASLAGELRSAMQGGERRPERFLASCGAVEVSFEDETGFVNVNCPGQSDDEPRRGT